MTHPPIKDQGALKSHFGLRSFRLRIALLSVSLAGTALVGFGLTTWFLIRQAKLQQLHEGLKTQLLQEGSMVHDDSHWPQYTATLPQLFGSAQAHWVALRVIDRQANTIFQSESWFAPLGKQIPAPDSALAAFLPLPPTLRQDAPGPKDLRSRPNQAGPRDRSKDKSRKAPREESGEEPGGPPNLPRNFRPRPPRRPPKPPEVVLQRTSTGNWTVGFINTPQGQVAIAIHLKTLDRSLAPIRNIILITIPTILAMVAFAAWFLAGQALRPLYRVNTAIGQLNAQGLDQRIPEGEADIEFAELIQVFNQMLGRLERSFQQTSRFSADAAHELKTPLAVLQGQLEREIQQAESGSRLQQSLGTMLGEVSRLGSILRKLLLLSLADAGRMRLTFSEVNLSELLQESVEDIELLAPHLSVMVAVEPQLRLPADPDLLRQVLQNLITNAVKYNRPDGWIRIETERIGQQVAVTIKNRSDDLSEDVRDRLFQRFYRADAAHSRRVEGAGLGLSLAQEIARAHRGDLRLAEAKPGETSMVLSLPLMEH